MGVVEDIREEVRSLQDKLEERRSKVETWCDKQRKLADEKEVDSMETLGQLKKEIQQLMDEHQELVSLGFTNSIRLEAERKKVQALESTLSELRDREKQVTEEMESQEASKRQVENEVAQAEASIAEEHEKQEYQVNQLTRGAKMYKKLGLEFERVSRNRLRMTFTHIDPSDWDRVFFFLVFIDEADHYHVEQVQPPVGDLTSLVHELNQTNNFSHFVRFMRRKFQALCGIANTQ